MPKIIGGSLHEHREQTRNRLFAALATLMEERGFDAISFAEIAAAAGVGRTAVYNHFADKEALLLGYIQHETGKYVENLQRSIADINDPVDRLRAYIRAQARLDRVFHVTPGTELRSILSRGAAQRLREHVTVIEDLLRDILGAGISAGEFPPQDINTSVNLINSCLTGRSLPENAAEWERCLEATEEFVLRAVGVRTPAPGLRRYELSR
ncbi:TetR/AcrR family transcriptional regulator [Timonella senegalensis]|uniref:TetR/AcrR family transcriptional regulator n=1 Tax=Timonella senegalensis TaxID=1465825 RepID=UPI002FE273EB